jgi:diguanylate cyclase (GGDEF)-like protein
VSIQVGARPRQWIVMLEAAGEPGGPGMDRHTFRRLLALWPSPAPTTLYSPDRYALQLPVFAADASSALSSAMSSWAEALHRAEVPKWDLVRAEVLTPAELERDLEAAEAADGAGDGHPPGFLRTEAALGDDLLRRALHDPVTGLRDRAIFLDEARRLLAAGAHARDAFTLMLIRLDGFAGEDGGLGRPMTDGVLVEVGRRLSASVRPDDMVARVGAREFAVLLALASGVDIGPVVDRVVSAVRSPAVDEGRVLALSARVGVATTECGDGVDDLILKAERALVSACGREGGSPAAPPATQTQG